MKPQIKEAKTYGAGGAHIMMSVGDAGKKFLVLPESSKYLLEELLNKYGEDLKDTINPLLKEFLNKEDFEIVVKSYKKKIDSIDKVTHKKLLESHYKSLNKFRLKDVGEVLSDIEDSLPKKVKEKLLGEYYKLDNQE